MNRNSSKFGYIAKHYLIMCLLFLLSVAVAFLRSPLLFEAPPLWYEDGNYIFGYYYTNDNFLSFTKLYYSDYIQILPNFMGYLSLRFPTAIAYRLIALLPLALLSLIVAWVYHPRNRVIVANDYARLAACLLLCLLPFTTHALIANTAYSHFNSTLLLVLLLIPPAPRHNFLKVIYFLVAALLIWSSGPSIILMPIWLLKIVIERGTSNRLVNTLLLLTTLSYWTFGLRESSVKFFTPVFEAVTTSIKFIIVQVCFPLIAGHDALNYLHTHSMEWVIYVCGGVLLTTTLGLSLKKGLKDKQYLCSFLILLYVIFTYTTCLMFVRDRIALQLYTISPRFVYLQQFLMIILIVSAIGPYLRRAFSSVSLKILSVSLIAVWLVALNISNIERYRSTLIENRSREIVHFIDLVVKEEERLGGRENIFAIKTRGKAGDIILAPSKKNIFIENPNFIATTTAEQYVPGWDVEGEATLSQDKTFRMYGPNSLKIEGNGSALQKVPLGKELAGKDLMLQAYLYSPGRDAQISLTLSSATQDNFIAEGTALLEGKHDSGTARVRLHIPPKFKGGEASIRLLKGDIAKNQNSGLPAYFDLVELYSISPKAKLLLR